MAKKRQEDAPSPGAPAWTATFGDLMNLLLCFFVLLFSMSTVDAQKFELIAASFSQSFSILSGGGSAIGDGQMIGNGVSQLNQLDQYISSMGKAAESDDSTDQLDEESARKALVEADQLKAAEELAEKIQESVTEEQLDKEIDIDFTSQYVSLTMNGALLFDSGSATIREDALPLLEKVGKILQRYAKNTIEIEGHTDNVPISNGKFASNDELSSFRALSVFEYLVDNTLLDPANIKHSGRGEYVPIADNTTEEGRAKNRRVEIKIYHSLSDS